MFVLGPIWTKSTFKVDDHTYGEQTAKVILKTKALWFAAWGKKDLQFVITHKVCGQSIVFLTPCLSNANRM